MIAMRGVQEAGGILTNDAGETTTHLQGMMARTARFLDLGIKPIFVFDGKPPTMKGGELAKRAERRKEANDKLIAAREEGNEEVIEQMNKRMVRVTREDNQDCIKLLRLMGVPVIEAPCEAEAQCAAIVKSGRAYATVTEDMDALTFGSPVLLRHMTFSESRKAPIVEVRLDRLLDGFKMTMDEFIDLCILCGCDYSDTIRGIGPKRAFEMLTKHKTIEACLEALDKEKYKVPEEFEFEASRVLFKQPDVTDPAELELKWTDPDVDGLHKFMVDEKGFDPQRINNVIERLRKARSKGTGAQQRLESFFGQPTVIKRKAPPAKKGKGKGKKARR